MKTIAEQQKEEFSKLLKEGKEVVWKYIESAEKQFSEIESPNNFDIGVNDILSTVRKEKRFSFNQYIEVERFLTEWKRLNKMKPQENDDYIIL